MFGLFDLEDSSKKITNSLYAREKQQTFCRRVTVSVSLSFLLPSWIIISWEVKEQ